MNATGILAGFYPERDVEPASTGDRAWSWGVYRLRQLLRRRLADPGAIAGEVAQHAKRLDGTSLEPLVAELRYRLRRAPATRDLIVECFACCCAALQRDRGPGWTLAPAAVGAARMLTDGGIVEIDDAADRQDALALAAAAMALRGVPVHLLTSCEARAQALAGWLRGPYAMLGIGVGLISHDMTARVRCDQYANLVVCSPLREVGLDYLRDRITLGGRRRRVLGRLDHLAGDASSEEELLLPGMRCALVDEADQILIDDSRTPLALTVESDQSVARIIYEQALELARALHEPAHYAQDAARIGLTDEGSQRIARLTQALGGVWAGRGPREALIVLALEALHVAQRDRDYRVVQGRVVLPPRPAEDTDETDEADELLQRLLEVKEGCRLSGRRTVLAQMTVPRLLGRYLHLAGTCADARGLEDEFWRLYRLNTVSAGGYAAARTWDARVYTTAAAKRDVLVERMREGESGAVVIALRSPVEAHALLEACAQRGLKVGFVRGAGDAAEQQAVAALDNPGGVVVTLYPAQRTVQRASDGVTPVRLVVGELHDATRHIGHIARAFGAHTCEIVLSLEDEAFKAHLGERGWNAAMRAAGAQGELPMRQAQRWVSCALRNAARAAANGRRDLAMMERSLDDLLAFSGKRE